jgi:hypothetical protein
MSPSVPDLAASRVDHLPHGNGSVFFQQERDAHLRLAGDHVRN